MGVTDSTEDVVEMYSRVVTMQTAINIMRDALRVIDVAGLPATDQRVVAELALADANFILQVDE